jgi:hypothetical protein
VQTSETTAALAGAITLRRVRHTIRVVEPSPTNKTMKKTIMSILCAGIASAIAIGAEVTTSTTTTTYGTGTIEEYSPGTTFIVKEKTGPVKYRYGKKVTYVTKSGKSLSDDEVRTRIRIGAPVRVYFDTDADAKVINKVEIDD